LAIGAAEDGEARLNSAKNTASRISPNGVLLRILRTLRKNALLLGFQLGEDAHNLRQWSLELNLVHTELKQRYAPKQLV
jgi:hypothetical protein